MRILSPQELEIGMVLMQDVVTPAGQLLDKAGATVTRQLINRMKLYRVETAAVEGNAEAPEVVLISDTPPAILPKAERDHTHIVETKTAKQKVAASSEFMDFQLIYYKAVETLKAKFADTIQNGTELNPEELLDLIKPLFQERATIIELFDMLNNMRAMDDMIYAHSVNVALVSRMIGRWLKLDHATLDILTEAGLLHDIGKCLIPEEILNKTGKLTDEEFAQIKSHPKLGYNILKPMNIDSRIKKAALHHHERCDESGYPSGLDEDNISELSMIIAIADVYDAMTAARSYRTPLCPFQVIAKFEDEGYRKYPTKYIMTFLKQIAATYQSNRVVLNDGRACKIIMLNKNDLSRPVVKMDDNTCIDLSAQRELSITSII